MSIVALDGTITTDTTSDSAAGTAFAFPDLLDAAAANDQGTAFESNMFTVSSSAIAAAMARKVKR